MHQDFNSTSSQKYWSIQEAEARLLVHNLMSEVDMMQLEKHLRKWVDFFFALRDSKSLLLGAYIEMLLLLLCT